MKIDLKSMVSISEANQNFSKVARMVDKNGAVVIMKNNKPQYILLDYNTLPAEFESSDDDCVTVVAKNIIKRNIEAFKELAK